MSKIVRLGVVSALVAALFAAQPAMAQDAGNRRDDERSAEQGPVVNLPQSPGMGSPSADGASFRAGSDPASAVSGSGGPIGSMFWGAVSDPKKESERRIKKLIERLG